MGLRFFADHCVPNSIVKELLNAGHEGFQFKICLRQVKAKIHPKSKDLS